ncbi:MAG: DUF2860 family protein [Parahaliea sp.]
MQKTLQKQASTLPSGLRPALAGSCILGAFFGSVIEAATIIPEKGGFGGYINLGAGVLSAKTNMIASIAGGNIDLSDNRIDTLHDAPDYETSAIPAFSFELSYTFAENKTQVYLGNLLQDYLDFDVFTQIGIRQGLGKAGIIGVAALAAPTPTEVWRDPYVSGRKRQATDRSSLGYRLRWERIMDTGLEVRYTTYDIDLDDDHSGLALNLDISDRKRLAREGDNKRLDVSYEFSLDKGRNTITPGIAYIDNDLDGDAMANNGYIVYANYIYMPGNRWRWVFNASYSALDFDHSNPVYGRRDDADRYGVSISTFYTQPFGLNDWALNISAGYYKEDHKLNFYDATVGSLSIGMFRTF